MKPNVPRSIPLSAPSDRSASDKSRTRTDADTDAGTVADYLARWLRGKQALRPSTLASYETHLRRYLVPHLGHIALPALRAEHIEQMYATLLRAGGVGSPSTATVRRIHATLMSALNTALRRGLIDRNPAATVELPRPARPATTAWSAEEFSAFLASAEGDRLLLLFVVLGLLGLRRGEALALRWSDVDLDNAALRVERTVVRLADGLITGPPKTANGARTIALDDETCRRLRRHRETQCDEAPADGGGPSTAGFVFTTPAGTQLDPAYVSRRFETLQRGTGLPRIRLHDLRHTSASIGLASGESLIEVSRRLGHSSITVTADIYSHISPAVARKSVARLARAVYNSPSGGAQ